MALASNFEQVSEDGKIIYPNMTASQIAALSGTIVKVVRARWVCDDKVVGIDNAKGLSAQATTSQTHVAILLAELSTFVDLEAVTCSCVKVDVVLRTVVIAVH